MSPTAATRTRDAVHLTYLNNRYYDPTLGNFVSVDPLVGKTGTPYLYANGNPATLSDPTGLCGVGYNVDTTEEALALSQCVVERSLSDGACAGAAETWNDAGCLNASCDYGETRCGTFPDGTRYETSGPTPNECKRSGNTLSGCAVPTGSTGRIVVGETIEDGSTIQTGEAIGIVGVATGIASVGSEICSEIGGANICGRISLVIDGIDLISDIADVAENCDGSGACPEAIVAGSVDLLIIVVTANSPVAAAAVGILQVGFEFFGNFMSGLQDLNLGSWKWVEWPGGYEKHYDAYYPNGVYGCGSTVAPWMNAAGGVCVP